MSEPLVTSGQEWSFDLIEEVYAHIERIATEKYKLDCYPNQLEMISSEQMLDAYCVDVKHKILRNDFKWIEAGQVAVGDVILGFDENGPHRSFKASTITNFTTDYEKGYAVTLSSGKILNVTEDHKWLIREKRGKTSRLKWVKTTDLRDTSSPFNQSCIPKVLEVWSERDGFDAGYIAGMFDGEGTTLKNTLQKLNVTQKTGAVLTKTCNILDKHGITYSLVDTDKSDIKTVSILGDISQKIQFLGEYQPIRLIERVDFDELGLMKTPNYEEVVSIEPIESLHIAKITTSTGTFICDGYPMHNCSVGLPVYYTHWSFGQQFIQEQEKYKRGYMGLAYEIVINSSPCIAYLMEENTMLMQTLVTAHASFGHNFFFKNNYLFKQWTDAEGIIDYLVFAKRYIRECEEKYGLDEVEAVLDAAHTLQHYGVDKYTRPTKLSAAQEENLRKERDAYLQSQLNQIWNTIPKTKTDKIEDEDEDKFPTEPQENILYFIEKHAPRMEAWKREIIRIVRKVAQYFYPQSQTKMMNEGCACFFHYKLIHDLHEEGILDDSAMLEFYHSHTGVVNQPDFDATFANGKPMYNGINPYALGFAMMQDIERIAKDPTEEDREWFGKQEWVGSGDYVAAIHHAVMNYKDESFIRQYLSPKVMRDFRFFTIHDDELDPKLEVSGIHNKQGYKIVRNALAAQHNISNMVPDIQVINADRWGDRSLTIQHTMLNNKPIEPKTATSTLEHLAYLWGYDVKLESVDDNNKIKAVFEIKGNEKLLDLFTDDE